MFYEPEFYSSGCVAYIYIYIVLYSLYGCMLLDRQRLWLGSSVYSVDLVLGSQLGVLFSLWSACV